MKVLHTHVNEMPAEKDRYVERTEGLEGTHTRKVCVHVYGWFHTCLTTLCGHILHSQVLCQTFVNMTTGVSHLRYGEGWRV